MFDEFYEETFSKMNFRIVDVTPATANNMKNAFETIVLVLIQMMSFLYF